MNTQGKMRVFWAALTSLAASFFLVMALVPWSSCLFAGIALWLSLLAIIIAIPQPRLS